jgi:carboxylate-amine ligase
MNQTMLNQTLLSESPTSTEFAHSAPLSLGIELELQVIDMSDYDLSSSAAELLRHLERQAIPATISPELTSSMIEVSVGIFDSWLELSERLQIVRDALVRGARWCNLGICGGGAHPFQRWQQRRIFDHIRFKQLSALYGYLAKQFTVFGQHIHVGCSDADTALWLLHSLNRYVPHFIALSASSPFFQGSTTSFHSSRLNSISAFPLSGRAPFYLSWDDFDSQYFRPMLKTGVVKSMKDFYWDIRPKPEYGTIELRVCDTPLSVDRAAMLAGYLQAICMRLLEERPAIEEKEYLVYSFNRFQASRFGMSGTYLHPVTHEEMTIRQSILSTIDWIAATKNPNRDLLALLIKLDAAANGQSDSERMMDHYIKAGTFEDVVQHCIDCFAE